MEIRDIFQDGPSPELQARWDRLDELEKEFYSLSSGGQDAFLKEHPEIRETVTCRECGQKVPFARRFEDVIAPSARKPIKWKNKWKL